MEAATESALASIDIGDSLPALTLKNEKDEDIQVADLTAAQGVVLFLVPKADTRKYRFKEGPGTLTYPQDPQRDAPTRPAASGTSTQILLRQAMMSTA